MTCPVRPAVSIGMPVYNCAKTVAAAIISIQRQTLTDWELILIDDGSSDGTLSVAEQFGDPRIRLIRADRNLGLPTRLNEAVRMSRGKYFARMDGDDISYPDRLKRQCRYISDHPELDLLGGAILVFDANGQAIALRSGGLTHDQIRGSLVSTFTLAHVTWIGSKEWFLQNPYRPEALLSQDRDLLMRTHYFSRFAAIPEVLVGVREPGVKLSKLLPSRLQYGTSLLRQSIVQRSPFLLGALAAEVVKAGLDLLAVGTGLNYRLLRHRVPPVPEQDCERWHKVWESVNTALCAPATPEEVHV
jgi:glycosyltransferase involved in cell wall biosynthesis